MNTNTGQTTQYVVFDLIKEEYAVSVDEVTEVVKTIDITPIPNSPKYIEGFTNLRGNVIPVINLMVKFNLQNPNNVVFENIIVVKRESTQYGVLVTKVIDVINVDLSSVQAAPEIVSEKLGSVVKGVIVLGKKDSPIEDVDNTHTNVKSPNVPTKERAILLVSLAKITEGEELEKPAGTNPIDTRSDVKANQTTTLNQENSNVSIGNSETSGGPNLPTQVSQKEIITQI